MGGPSDRFRAEAVTGPVAEHGEGPVWDHRAGLLRCVDMARGDLLAFPPDGGEVTRHHVGSVAAALRPRRAGGWVVALERGFALLDADLRTEWESEALWPEPGVRFNDGACDPSGAFLCGSMAEDETPGAGAVYRLRPDRVVETLLRDVTVPNGLAFDADGRHATWIDTPTRRIDRVEVDPADGRWTGRSTFVEVAADGVPDGLTVDAEGAVWVALFTGGAVRRYTADGTLDVEVPLPVSGTTACTLGGPDRRRLFVTTSARGIDPADEPLAGAVFAIDVDVPGESLYAFDG